MRTTLAIDADVRSTTRSIARQRKQTSGRVISGLPRNSRCRSIAGAERNGTPLLRARHPGTVVTAEIVNALRDESP